MNRKRWGSSLTASLSAVVLCVGCRADSAGQLGSETNWLGDCRVTEACSKGSCVCGICTAACDGSNSCGKNAVCATAGTSAHESLCQEASMPPAGVCVASCTIASDCSAGMSCVGGTCLNASESGHLDASVHTSGQGGVGGRGGTGGAMGGDAMQGSGGVGTSPDASTGSCNSLPEPTRGAQVRFATGPAPGGSGGAVRDGVYELESAVVYVGGPDAGASIEGRAHRISITGRLWESVSYFDNAPTTRYDDEATLSGNKVTLKRVCGDAGSGILFGTAGTYTASDSALVLNFAAGSAFGNGTAVLTFQRAPEIDGGGAACVGDPCTNSYDCCPTDAGGPPFGISCGANGTCVVCNVNGLNDPCLGRSPNSPEGSDCCPGLRCVNNRCVL